MTEKTKAIIILIAVAIAFYIFVSLVCYVPTYYLLANTDIFFPSSPLNEFYTSISYLLSALAQVIFILVLFKVINTNKECMNGKFNYNIDKFFYIALALGILKISHVLIFSHLHYLDSHNIADYVISELISIIVFSIITELFYRHWTITFLEKYGFQPRTICIISVIMYYVMKHLYLLSAIELNLGSVVFDALFYVISGIILYQLYTKTRDVRYCIIMQMIIAATGTIITVFHSFMLPHIS
jgi:hypothetical protein